jgi:hypothetical protein
MASRAAEKVTMPSFRGGFFVEESLFYLNLNRREILRFDRNDGEGKVFTITEGCVTHARKRG